MRKEIDAAIEQINERLKAKVLARLPAEGKVATDIEALSFSRKDENDKIENCFYEPVFGIVIQGSKRSMIGNAEYQYGKYDCIVASVDIPSVTRVRVDSPEEPFLALSIKLDRYLVAKLLAETSFVSLSQKSNSAPAFPESVYVSEVSYEILDASLRLVNLLDHPQSIPVLAPMILREIHYHLLTGPQGNCLRMVCASGTKTNRIAEAISWLRENYVAPLKIETLAKQVNMTSSSFHRHFRRVTTLSPLQFQKRLRLYEAERVMLTEGKDAATAAFDVGYESATQFNREYKRMFGAPPHRDVNRKRTAGIE